ncbi:MAG TPA: hypothetical protein DEO73_08575 [Pantoea sp.]|nr:hypothetical protein [Pantoea sp.]
MINVIIPMSGKGLYEVSSDFIYPKILTEVANKTLLEYSQAIFNTLKEPYKRVFVTPEDKLNSLGLKTIIEIISNNYDVIVPLAGITKGAVCSSLMAIDEVDIEDELIISSADHFLNENLQSVVDYFRKEEADAGVLTFESVHPKWSFVKLDALGTVIESAEKKAISKNAVAGLYYFKRAGDFFDSAKNVIRKDNSLDGIFYLSSCLNEFILSGKKVSCKPLSESVYHNFYDAHAVKSFEASNKFNTSIIKDYTKAYIKAFDQKNLMELSNFFDSDTVLTDPGNHIVGDVKIKEMLVELFNSNVKLSFNAKRILVDKNNSLIEFELTLNDKTFIGVDLIEWSADYKIKKLDAYLY